MKKLFISLFTSLFLIFFPLVLFSQTLKESTKFFSNGKPMFVDYKDMETLKKVKTDIFNESGTLIFSVNFNENGKMDGEFYDLINKGFFKNGELTCYDCKLVSSNNPSVYSYNWDKQNTELVFADIIKGKFSGKVVKKRRIESTRSFVDWDASRNAFSAGAPIWYREVRTLRTGDYKESDVYTVNYNTNGLLDGVIHYSDREVYVENGLTIGFVIRDSNGVRDSIFNKNKIWKINYKYIKNDGYVIFNNPLVENDYEWHRYKNENRRSSSFSRRINGPTNLILVEGDRRTQLDENGMYTKIAEKNFTEEILYLGAGWKNFVYKAYNAIINGINKKIDYEAVVNFKDKLSANSPDNYFKKYLNSNFPEDKEFFKLSVNDVFMDVIRADDYFKAIKESIESGENTFLEMIIFNDSENKYDIIDIEDLISKGERYQNEIEASNRLEIENNEKEKSKQLVEIKEEILVKGFKINSLVENKYVNKALKKWGRKNDIGFNIIEIKVLDFKVSDVNNLDINFCQSRHTTIPRCYDSKREFRRYVCKSSKSGCDKSNFYNKWESSWKINDDFRISFKKFINRSDIEKLIKKFNHQITLYTFETLIDLKNYEKNYPSDILKTDYKNLTLTYNLEWK